MLADRHVLLLRGVNVGGANALPMAAFRTMLAEVGFGNPRTYIQSGNAVVDSDLPVSVVADRVRAGLAGRFGLQVPVFVLHPDELAAALQDHPFVDAPPDRVHAFFLEQPSPPPPEDQLHALAAPGDGWVMKDRLFLLHTPAGIGRSKLAERLPGMFFGAITARNLRSVAAILALARAKGA